jgi:4-hydroxy-tetrahydrodipicolinate synthase
MVMKYLEGNKEEALEMQLKAIPLVKQLFAEVNPIPVKYAMNLLGFKAGKPRLPLTELEDAHKVSLEKAMKEYGLL